MKTIKQSYLINASPQKVFEALTKPAIIEKWSGSQAKMDDRPGTKFELWKGDMFGTNLEVEPNRLLVQEWCTKNFRSTVTFVLKPKGRKTLIELIHELPDKYYNDYSEGWKKYYLGAIQAMFE